MNEVFVLLGVESWKSVLSALVLPPMPSLLLVLVGARVLVGRRLTGWALILAGAATLWLGSTWALADWGSRALLGSIRALTPADVAQLKREQAAGTATAIVVLGGGREPLAPEYGMSTLSPSSAERLRYAVWLSRESGVPLAFSGGVGYAQGEGVPEAEVAARIAATEFSRPLKWLELRSRDTRENAGYSVALLRQAGLKRIVVVTHGWHMRRALRDFEEAARRSGGGLRISAAPMGLSAGGERSLMNWLPSNEGMVRLRQVTREALGLLAGA